MIRLNPPPFTITRMAITRMTITRMTITRMTIIGTTITRTAIGLAALSLSACASTPREGFPTLTPRPIEAAADDLLNGPAPVAAATPNADPGPDTTSALARADAASRRFDSALASARRAHAAARGSAQGSERWVLSQMAISIAEAERLPVIEALADIDRLYLDAADAGADNVAPIGAVRQKLARRVVEQANAIRALR